MSSLDEARTHVHDSQDGPWADTGVLAYVPDLVAELERLQEQREKVIEVLLECRTIRDDLKRRRTEMRRELGMGEVLDRLLRVVRPWT